MKRFIAISVLCVLAASCLVTPAGAKKKAKPVATKLYLHGATVVGENDSFFGYNEAFLPMDKAEPTGSEPKSRWITNYLVGPNTHCSGNNVHPVWSGALTGQIKGDVKLTLNTVGTPGDVVVRIWPDIDTGVDGGCQNYVDPAGEVVVTIPPGAGTVEAVMKNVSLKAVGSIVIQISPVLIPTPGGSVRDPFMSRILYDTSDFASVLEFSCVPASGTSCTP